MELPDYDENEALERALKESLESANSTKTREEEDLELALKLSAEQETYPSSEAEALAAAIALSMDDAANIKAIQEMVASKNRKDMKVEEIHLPIKLVANFKKLVFNYELELGVKLYVVFDGGINYKIRIVAYDVDVMFIAKSTLESIVEDPVQMELKLEALKGERVHIFVDYSNIFIGSQWRIKNSSTMTGRESIVKDLNVRLKCPALAALIESNRNCLEKHIFASLAPEHGVWRSWENLSYKKHTYQRGNGEGEQFVDDASIAMINQAILKYPNPPHPPHTLVLLTGDGNDNSGRASFFSSVNDALVHGWKVELWTWRCAMSNKYLELLEVYGAAGVFKIMYLDAYREQVTFNPTEKKEKEIGQNLKGPLAKFQQPTSTSNVHAHPNRFTPIDLVSDDEAEEEEHKDDMEGDWYNCPLTSTLLNNPVVIRTTDRVFERDALNNWIRTRKTCPLTGEPLTVKDVRPASKDFIDKLEKYKRERGRIMNKAGR